MEFAGFHARKSGFVFPAGISREKREFDVKGIYAERCGKWQTFTIFSKDTISTQAGR